MWLSRLMAIKNFKFYKQIDINKLLINWTHINLKITNDKDRTEQDLHEYKRRIPPQTYMSVQN